MNTDTLVNSTNDLSSPIHVNLADYIIYRVGDDKYFGKAQQILPDQIITVRYNELLERLGEEDIISQNQVICNFYAEPPQGSFLGFTFNPYVRTIRVGSHKVNMILPVGIHHNDIKNLWSAETTQLVEALVAAFEEAHTEVSSVKSYFDDKTFTVNITEGQFHLSSAKKGKEDFDYILNLQICYQVTASLKDAFFFAIAPLLWKISPVETKSDWLQVFATGLTYERIDNATFTDKFVEYISADKDPKKPDMAPEDEIVCKLLIKEIKRVKCLSLKDLRILLDTVGSEYIIREILPEVVNSVRLRNSIRINPLINMNALKKFGLELRQYLSFSGKNVDPQYEQVIQLFFD